MNSTARFEYVRHKYLIKLIPWFALYVVLVFYLENEVSIFNHFHIVRLETQSEKFRIFS